MVIDSERKKANTTEFIALMAMLTSLTALAIDAILPALPAIAAHYDITRTNDLQLMVSCLFLGLAIGQLFYGPLSDSYGRKVPTLIGLAIFIFGTILALFSTSYSLLLIARTLQGIGAAGPKVISVALIRDRYKGREMARIMSFIMAVFIIVPTIAPALGQAILYFSGWREIFWAFLIMASLVFTWFAWRQDETLEKINRPKLSAKNIIANCKETLNNQAAMRYTLGASFSFAGFIVYLSTAQAIFADIYNITDTFPLYFGLLSLALGISAIINARLVISYGMQTLIKRALIALIVFSCLFIGPNWYFSGQPPLAAFLIYLLLCFFVIGMLFGNFNSLAMESLGHIAGVASAVIGSITTLISMLLGALIGQFYQQTLTHLVVSFLILASITLYLSHGAEKPS